MEFLKENKTDYSVPMAKEILTEHDKAVAAAKASGQPEPDTPGIFKDGRIYMATATVSHAHRVNGICATAFCDNVTSACHFECKHPLCMRCYSGLMTASSDMPDEEWGYVVQRQCPLCRAPRQQPPPQHEEEEDDVILVQP